MARPEIRPSHGFCIQTDSLGSPAGRWYLNLCRHSLVEMPVAHSGKVVSREYILSHGIASMQIPFDMGSFRKLKERAEGARHTAYCVDVVFNPFIVQLFTDDAFNSTMTEYRPFIINLVLKRVESSIGVKLSTQKVKLVKKFLYKDGEGRNADEPRAFTDLPQEIDTVEDIPVQPPRNPPAETPSEPLIQDVTPGKKKPAMKKGFLNNASAALYPEGSKEGVVPENAGDPLGYLPKKLRNTCKVVDCNSPEYLANQKKQQAAEEHNNMNKEFSDMLTRDLGAWSKPGNQWDQDDLPDGSETPATQKYEVDYSRFDKVDDVDEDKPEIEQRDWYSDEKGVIRSHRSSKAESDRTAAKPSGEGAEPAIKKGFLDNAKTPLYPKGSEQRAPPNEAEMLKSLGNEAELMKSLGKFMGEEGLPEPQVQTPQALKPTINAKVPERKAPEFTLERDDNEGLLQLVVDVPGLQSMQGVDLDITETCASLAFPSAVGLRPLKVELATAVIPTSVRAKFSKKTHQIVVKMPLLLKVAKAG
jgi:hypothetical protein